MIYDTLEKIMIGGDDDSKEGEKENVDLDADSFQKI